jgi:FkbM family methyltransferase
VNLETRSGVAMPWVSREVKDVLARCAAPWARRCRLLPSARVRKLVWHRLISPHVWWREFDFVARTGCGAILVGNTAEYIQRYIYYFGVWEPNLTAWIARRLKPGDLFIDIGANIGYFSLLASRLVGKSGQVVAIEPSAPTFALLRRNLDRNEARNVRAVNVAVSDCEEELQLFLHPGNDSGRTTVVRSWADKRKFVASSPVRALPLEAILQRGEIEAARLIKIDVEGYEDHVLSGLLRLLPFCRRDAEIIVEVNPSILADQGRTSADLLSGFESLGFNLYEIENDYEVSKYVQADGPKPAFRLADHVFMEQKDVILSRQARETI